jgi:cytochrome b6-f complex iron-sulfur subunit
LDDNSIYSEKQSRRDFLNYVLGLGFLGWLLAVLYPIYSYLKPPKAPEVDVSNLKLGKVEEFPVDSGKIFKIGSQPGLLIRLPDGKFKAFNATCTHLSCTVQYKPDEKIIWCACHNGKYDLNGKNISGPPPSPLTPYNVSVKNDEVFVSK